MGANDEKEWREVALLHCNALRDCMSGATRAVLDSLHSGDVSVALEDVPRNGSVIEEQYRSYRTFVYGPEPGTPDRLLSWALTQVDWEGIALYLNLRAKLQSTNKPE